MVVFPAPIVATPVTVMDTIVTFLSWVVVVATPPFATVGKVLGEVIVAVMVAVPAVFPPVPTPVDASIATLLALLEDQVTKEEISCVVPSEKSL